MQIAKLAMQPLRVSEREGVHVMCVCGGVCVFIAYSYSICISMAKNIKW